MVIPSPEVCCAVKHCRSQSQQSQHPSPANAHKLLVHPLFGQNLRTDSVTPAEDHHMAHHGTSWHIMTRHGTRIACTTPILYYITMISLDLLSLSPSTELPFQPVPEIRQRSPHGPPEAVATSGNRGSTRSPRALFGFQEACFFYDVLQHP